MLAIDYKIVPSIPAQPNCGNVLLQILNETAVMAKVNFENHIATNFFPWTR